MRTVTVTSPVEKRCPYMDEPDLGTVTLTFSVEADAPELHKLADDLSMWAVEPVSHEDFTARLLTEYAPAGCTSVRSTWRTAGMEVTVDVSGEPE